MIASTVILLSTFLLSALVPQAAAHGYLASVTIGGKEYPAWDPNTDPWVPNCRRSTHATNLDRREGMPIPFHSASPGKFPTMGQVRCSKSSCGDPDTHT